MDKYLEINILPKLNQEERDNLNKPISRSEIESIIKKKKSLQTKVQDQTASREFYQTYKELILLKPYQNIEEEGTVTNSFYEATITMMQKPEKDTNQKKEKKITGQYI